MDGRRLEPADAGILAGLLSLPLLLFAEALTGARVFYERDIHTFWLPKVESFVRVVSQGSWPLWDPWFGVGQPLLADPGSQVLYPFTWLNLVLLPSTVYTIVVVAHAWLAAAGTYALARAWGMSRPAAALAGIGFAASGPFLSAVNLYHHYMGAAWVPWSLFSLERLLARPTARSAAGLGAVAGVQVLTGSGDMVVLAGLAALMRLAAAAWPGAGARLDSRRAGWVAAAGGLALALSAAQWVPTAALLRGSSRGTMPVQSNLYWSVHPAALVELLLPRALGSLPLSETARATLFESREPFLASLYLGLVPALTLVPLAASFDRRRAATAALAAGAFMVAALGRHTPVLPALLHLPGLSWFRYPVKYTIGVALFWSLLAGLGLEAWRQPWTAARARGARLVVAAAVVTLAALVSAEWIRVHARDLGRWVQADVEWRPAAYAPLVSVLRRAAALAALAGLVAAWRSRAERAAMPVAAALALAAADLVTAGRGVNDLAPRALLTSRPPVLALLDQSAGPERLYTPPVSNLWLNRSLVRGPAGWTQAWGFALGLQESLEAPIGARWGLRGSYDADFTGLAPPRLPTLSSVVARYADSAPGVRLLRMAGVTHVVSLHASSAPGLIPAGEVPSVFADPVRVFGVPAPLPRAYLVAAARVAADTDALSIVGDASFDPGASVVLEAGPAAAMVPGYSAGARLVEARPDRWRVETQANAPGYLVVLDAADAGWTASVDGRPADVLRANLLFRAVAVAAGRHTVEMRYRPRAVVVGLALSAAGLGALAALARGRRGARAAAAVDAAPGAGLPSPAAHA